jgi:hypothetical protein
MLAHTIPQETGRSQQVRASSAPSILITGHATYIRDGVSERLKSGNAMHERQAGVIY